MFETQYQQAHRFECVTKVKERKVRKGGKLHAYFYEQLYAQGS